MIQTNVMTGEAPRRPEAPSRSGVHGRAYRHKGAEALLYLMFVTGLLLWPFLELHWSWARGLLLAHMLLGVLAFPFLVGPFWWSHRALLLHSRKPLLRATGQVLELLLASCVISGLYLVFVGAPGNALGNWMSGLHFYTSWLLTPLVFYHALRWSVMNLRRYVARPPANQNRSNRQQ